EQRRAIGSRWTWFRCYWNGFRRSWSRTLAPFGSLRFLSLFSAFSRNRMRLAAQLIKSSRQFGRKEDRSNRFQLAAGAAVLQGATRSDEDSPVFAVKDDADDILPSHFERSRRHAYLRADARLQRDLDFALVRDSETSPRRGAAAAAGNVQRQHQ